MTIGYGGPSGESFCWKFEDDGLVPVSMPGEMNLIGDNCFKCSKSGFDSFQADGESDTYSSGRCFYNYYYFFEYNGLAVDNIYYRSNGIININCSYRTEKTLWPDEPPKSGTGFMYIELKLTDNGFETEKGLTPGRIKASLTPDCAIYPD